MKPGLGAVIALLSAVGCGGAEFSASVAARAGGAAGVDHGSGAAAGVDYGRGGAAPVLPGAGAPAMVGGEQAGGVPGAAGGDGGEPPLASAGAGGDADPGAGGSTVVGQRGPTLVKAGSIHIDSTEVTVAQYAAFLRDKADDTSGQPPECSWNDSFVPGGQMGPDDHPVTNVDFCDAAAFCAWAGKRLCGKLGGGELQIYEVPDATKSEWFSACGGAKGQPYPYGSEHVPGACNDATGSGAIAAVASFPQCTGAPNGVYDMVGNVSEWVDACDAAVNGWDGCETIGGSFADSLPCSGSGLRHRDQQEPNLGFRCCAN